MPREITLTQGLVAIVDDEDYERVAQYEWHRGGHGIHIYAVRYVPVAERLEKDLPQSEKMHRLIHGLTKSNKEIVDHIDHNGLNNVRSNLRVTTFNGNNRNRNAIVGKKSQYKGVSRIEDRNWHATIRIDGEPTRLGAFETEREAGLAYDFFARKHFGEFAVLNFPNEVPNECPKRVTRISRRARGATGYKGVRVIRQKRTANLYYQASIKNGYLGCFATPEDAARAYDRAARELYGPDCFLNFPDEFN